MKHIARLCIALYVSTTYSCAVSGLSAGLSPDGQYSFSVALRPTGKTTMPVAK